MPIEGYELLLAAKRLVNSHMEVDHRTAASRAYYAALHCSFALRDLLDFGPLPLTRQAEGTHRRMIRLLLEAHPGERCKVHVGRLRAVAHLLRMVRDLRSLADYRLDLPFNRPLAMHAILGAERVVREVREILATCAAEPPAPPTRIIPSEAENGPDASPDPAS
ncbi:MAG: hypothetical protein HQL56_06995 [Magnetococcales bacterium]|nr:hypothetical protein [Magnetococcales bacterium]